MTPAITAGDVDADWEDAYFTGDEAPGGDNPTPDRTVVDDIGKALGVQYEDDEELKGSDKVIERDKHRWELDPASAEDYKKDTDRVEVGGSDADGRPQPQPLTLPPSTTRITSSTTSSIDFPVVSMTTASGAA